MAGRGEAVAAARALADDGRFEAELARLVAVPTESQEPRGTPHLARYLDTEMAPRLASAGFRTRIRDNPVAGAGPVLLATREEGEGLPRVLVYGHGDTIRAQEGRWGGGRAPWRLTREGDRLYGRGTADNKAQHLVNLAAMRAVIETRGRLGFNAAFLIETGEETGSPGLGEIAAAEREALRPDVLIASDGPRIRPDRPTVSLGCRGATAFELRVALREGAHHSGNWGGALADPATILAHALAAITDARGTILVPEWRPPWPSDTVRALLRTVEPSGGEDGPAPDPDWGEPGLSPAERVHAWNSFAVLAMEAGIPAAPVNAIAPVARAVCQLRWIAGTDEAEILPALRRHLDRAGFGMVEIVPAGEGAFRGTRTEPDHPWARWVRASIERTTGEAPDVIPQMGGSICNDVFTGILGIPAIWVPHSYAGCRQHAPDEHVLLPLCRDALGVMAGLWWDLGEPGTPGREEAP
jgi:acetylornithine deacetylase/succinyl-diaminopimelate desuccinylase-like protein